MEFNIYSCSNTIQSESTLNFCNTVPSSIAGIIRRQKHPEGLQICTRRKKINFKGKLPMKQIKNMKTR